MLSKLISGWAYNRDKIAFCRTLGKKGGWAYIRRWAYYRASTVMAVMQVMLVMAVMVVMSVMLVMPVIVVNPTSTNLVMLIY